jgi:phosphocarrier protein
MASQKTTIKNKTGIHARPASVFVQTASKFKSKVQIAAKGKKVDAKSILMIMSMGLSNGTEITISADGPDEADAVKTLVDLVDSKFGED